MAIRLRDIDCNFSEVTISHMMQSYLKLAPSALSFDDGKGVIYWIKNRDSSSWLRTDVCLELFTALSNVREKRNRSFCRKT